MLFSACGESESVKSSENEATNNIESTSEISGTDANELSFEEVGGRKMAYKNKQPFSGVALNYFKDGSLHYSTSYKDGYKNGEWRIWFSNGNLQKVGNTLNEKEEGIYREYYKSGKLKYEYHYKQGKKVDIWKSWYENGQQWTSRDFKNNILDGKVLVWDTDGTLTKEYTYRNGTMIGKEHYFEEE